MKGNLKKPSLKLILMSLGFAIVLAGCSKPHPTLEVKEVGRDFIVLNHKNEQVYAVTSSGLRLLRAYEHESDLQKPAHRHSIDTRSIAGNTLRMEYLSVAHGDTLLYRLNVSPLSLDEQAKTEWFEDRTKREGQVINIHYQDQDNFTLFTHSINLSEASATRIVNQDGIYQELMIESNTRVDGAIMSRVSSVDVTWRL